MQAIKNLLPFASVLVLFSCGSGVNDQGDSSLGGEVVFEFLDSIVVGSLSELYLADMDEHTGRLLFNDWYLKELFFTDLKGELISRFELAGEGPNQVLHPTEVAFWKDGIVVKEMSEEGKLNFFSGDLEKTGKSPALSKALYVLTIPNSGRSFSVLEKEDKTLLVGNDYNSLGPELMTPEGQDGSFYSKAETGYIYIPDSEELYRLNFYPESWKPKMEQKWVGMASPFVQVSKRDQLIALLPRYGNQLFLYELNGGNLSPLSEIKRSHAERNENIAFNAKKDDGILYPSFTNLIAGGEYFLIQFRTPFPRDLFESFQANGEEFHRDPEFWEAVEKHHQAKYILTDTKGNQGTISKLPVPGEVHYMDADDVLYLKPISETELDYNAFYRYQVSLK